MICDTGSLLLLVPRPTYRGRPVQKACPSYNFLSSYNLPTPPECVLRHPKIEHLHLPTSLRPSTPPVVSSRTRAPLPPEGNYSRCETLESIKVSIWATEVWRRRGSSWLGGFRGWTLNLGSFFLFIPVTPVIFTWINLEGSICLQVQLHFLEIIWKSSGRYFDFIFFIRYSLSVGHAWPLVRMTLRG